MFIYVLKLTKLTFKLVRHLTFKLQKSFRKNYSVAKLGKLTYGEGERSVYPFTLVYQDSMALLSAVCSACTPLNPPGRHRRTEAVPRRALTSTGAPQKRVCNCVFAILYKIYGTPSELFILLTFFL